MQIGDLIKPKIHLEALREPHREDHGLLEVHTRWEDPVGTERVRRRDRRNKSGIAMMVPKIKLLIGGQVALITKGKLEHLFELV